MRSPTRFRPRPSHNHGERRRMRLRTPGAPYSFVRALVSWMNSRYAQGQYKSVVTLVAETLHDSFRSSLRILQGEKRPHEIRANAVGGEDQQIAFGHWKHCGLQKRQVVADHTASE